MNPPLRALNDTAEPPSHARSLLNAPVSSTGLKGRDLSAMSARKEKQPEQRSFTPLEDIRSEDVLGEFSYAPATQTTVVTTTTTTTTKFPPLIMKAPQHLYDLDPKQYPLASSPTPQSIKKLCFDIDGRPTIFQEADDTLETLQTLKHRHRALVESQGALRSVADDDPNLETPILDETRTNRSNAPRPRLVHNSSEKSRRKRTISPVSISEAAALASKHGNRKRRMVSSGRPSPSPMHTEPITQKPSHSRLHLVQMSTPVTPHLDGSVATGSRRSPAWGSKAPDDYDPEDPAIKKKTTGLFESADENEDDHRFLSPRSEVTRNVYSRQMDIAGASTLDNPEVQTPWQELGVGSAMTPHMEIDGDEGFPQFRYPARPRPPILDTTAAQDVSLPSPSLSPVTAAANMQSRREYFEQPSLDHMPQILGRADVPESSQSIDSSCQNSSFVRTFQESPTESQGPGTLDLAVTTTDTQPSTCSMMNIPSMVDSFESMPEEMKSYLVYQFLRRCSKPVLHFVAGVVNPALKCDFLKLLPLELSLNIIGNLDARTLCRAAQVSKYWRQLIDSSERAWKRAFDADYYTLSGDELQRAIREGWGWQYASQSSDFEKDLSLNYRESSISRATHVPYDHPLSDAVVNSHSGSAITQTKRPKRKGKSKPKPSSRKQAKVILGASDEAMDLNEGTIIDIASAEGPYAAASLAKRELSEANIGLASLRNMHLFKSIYMRHHLIRKTWMTDDVSPRHIAFRAHQRHVVTCLQFDADKILTGSDDAKINVYDTKTGRLRAKLEGHEGGVWALQYEGNVLVSGSTDRTVRVWDIEKGRCTQIFQGHTSTVRCLQILLPTPVGKTHDGRSVLMPKQPLIITGSRDSNLRVWKLPKSGDADLFQTGPAPDEAAECPYYVRTLAGHHHSVRAIAAHADTLVSGSYDCSVRVWRISTGETVHRLNGHSQKVYSVVLDTDRNRCISGSMDNLVKVWSLETGSVLFNLEGHSSLVGLLDLQQNRLVSAAADSTLRIWDPENGQCQSTLRAHTGAITCFQHDGQKVISGSDRTLKMWNVADGEFAKDLLTDLSGVWQVKFNERRCVAAVQRNNLTYIEVLDFGASRDGVPKHKRGKRIVVNAEGKEVSDPNDSSVDGEIIVDD